MTKPTLEIPIDTLGAARFSAAKTDRLEVCADLASEGWTPSLEFLQSVVDAVADQATEVVSLIRPRLADQPVGLEAHHFLASPAILAARDPAEGYTVPPVAPRTTQTAPIRAPGAPVFGATQV